MSGVRGNVEADETFIGGLAKFMHRSERKRVVRGTGGMDKTPVFGLLEGGARKGESRVLARVANRIRKHELQGVIRGAVEKGAAIHTDAFYSYRGLDEYRDSRCVVGALGNPPLASRVCALPGCSGAAQRAWPFG
jgi:hypothetical protein